MIIGEKNMREQTFVIAEVGNNHEGDFDVAIELINQAAIAELTQ